MHKLLLFFFLVLLAAPALAGDITRDAFIAAAAARAADRFDAMDANRDGTLTAAERRAVREAATARRDARRAERESR